jgi:hypothetical protein
MPTFIIYAIVIAAVGGLGFGIVSTYNSALEEAQEERQMRQDAEAEALALQRQILDKEYDRQIAEFEKQQAEKANKETQQQVEDLETIFSDHDFGNLYDKKPGLILNRVNAATDRVLQQLVEVSNGNTQQEPEE